jgi:predicted nucleotidyltransferase
LQQALIAIVTGLETNSGVEGAFLSGSLANEYQDEYSDIDVGIATRNSVEALNNAFALRHELLAAVGQPIHSLDRGWGHCKMIAALFGTSQFPPIGLEIDLIFSQLRYVSEQMPYAEYRIILDRNGKLHPVLAEMSQSRPQHEIEREIVSHLKWLPFYVHDALKACKRADEFQVQALLEEIRKLVFFAAAARHGKQVYGSKRARRYLSADERSILEDSYRRSNEATVGQLADVYFACLMDVKVRREIRDSMEHARTIVQELL